ncbi:hypothetical protein GCM10007862_11900 [Dyella lipolytica]|uniref:DUF8082 domain-containing protein n=1 Tax=Dyella lipolytica TaxID=1867835 RepID=A0ABW8IW47_9GAMM|nr:hypothetical protein [Dyella lipolytica]GLQ46139.1 hypothetical protein GCM10007862_11900 [Dyella lipolytica]
MVSEFRPLISVLRELKTLAQKKASGFFFIATESNHSSTIRLRNGHIEDVVFSRYRNDEAVRYLSKVTTARARFQPGAISATENKVPLSEAALQWLLGGFESGPSARQPQESKPAASATITTKLGGPGQREIVEKVALNFFGPIATLLCDEAFSASSDIERVLAQIASNMPTSEEAERFLAEAHATLVIGK